MFSHSFCPGRKKGLHLGDEVQFIRSWIEKPLSTGAVMPSSRVLARAMARYVDPRVDGPVIELGPGTGPVTEALVKQVVDPARLILAEFNPDFCRLLRTRYPAATVVQGRRLSAAATSGDLCVRTGRRDCVGASVSHQTVVHAAASDF